VSAASCTLTDIDGVVAALAPGGGIRLVNHWATWCLGCVDEFDELKSLVRALDGRARVFGVSWDLFDPRGDEEDIREQVENFGAGHQLTWPSLLLDASVKPPDFMAALSLEFDQIPQTWLIADDGTVLHRVNGVLDAAESAAVLAALGAAS
jgi:peroxiredoxin